MRGGTLLAIFFIISLLAGFFLFQNSTTTGKVVTTCLTNWSCTDWSPCADGKKIKTCVDTNLCGITTGKPSETGTCEIDCAPDWTCTEWTPEECPEEGIQTKECIDQNHCGTVTNMPENARECKYKETFEWLFYVIIVINILTIFLIIALLIGLFYKFNKPPKEFIPKPHLSMPSNPKNSTNLKEAPKTLPRIDNILPNTQKEKIPQKFPAIPTIPKAKAPTQPTITTKTNPPQQSQTMQAQTPIRTPQQPQTIPSQTPIKPTQPLPQQTPLNQPNLNELMPKSNSHPNFKIK